MTDLSEFGGGIDRSELDEADQFHASLSDWIRSDAVSVYSREQKSYTNGTFENDRSFKPQFLIEGPSYTYVVRTQLADDGRISIRQFILCSTIGGSHSRQRGLFGRWEIYYR